MGWASLAEARSSLAELAAPHETTYRSAVKEGLDAGVRKRLYEKVPELQRRSLVPRVCDLVGRWNVEWRDLFPPHAALEEELREAYHRRSLLVHEGESGDWLALMRDSRRVHALTERMVYKILDVPDAWTEPRSYEYASWHWAMDVQ